MRTHRRHKLSSASIALGSRRLLGHGKGCAKIIKRQSLTSWILARRSQANQTRRHLRLRGKGKKKSKAPRHHGNASCLPFQPRVTEPCELPVTLLALTAILSCGKGALADFPRPSLVGLTGPSRFCVAVDRFRYFEEAMLRSTFLRWTADDTTGHKSQSKPECLSRDLWERHSDAHSDVMRCQR